MPRRILNALFNNEQDIGGQASSKEEQRQPECLDRNTARMYGQSQAKPAAEKDNKQTSDLKNDTDDMVTRTQNLNISADDEPAIHGQTASPAIHDNVCNEASADKNHPMLNHVQEPELHGERPATGSTDDLNIQSQHQQKPAISTNTNRVMSPTYNTRGGAINGQSPASPSSPTGVTHSDNRCNDGERGLVSTHFTETGYNDLSNAYRKNQLLTEDDDQYNDINEVYRGNAQGYQPTDALSDTSSVTSGDLQQANDIRGVYRAQSRVLRNNNGSNAPNVLAGGAGRPQYNNMSDVYRSSDSNFATPHVTTSGADEDASSNSTGKGFKGAVKEIFGRRKSNASSSSSSDSDNDNENVNRVDSSRGKNYRMKGDGRQPVVPSAPSMMGNSDAELYKQQMQQHEQFARMPNAENVQPAGTRDIGENAEDNFVKQPQRI
ncbi:hypothetical protein BDF20DRAFT_863998 [Mycotypha africana]|uniref:uncharacterized protein n=1 Tax=Mycotypha africana TaxID=64632 RepID=UPI00230167F0|nr:uncharacterized protein BDF20DRAFT_863998 [Mycotypha africana]KAI8981919.1 hypothetical protein BDF20DRAFT_863998 [Mycotypha africana]